MPCNIFFIKPSFSSLDNVTPIFALSEISEKSLAENTEPGLNFVMVSRVFPNIFGLSIKLPR